MAKSQYSVAIGSRIRARRKSLEINQEALAKSLGVGQSSIAQYEAGNREINASELVRLAEILRVPISYFYGEINPFEQLDSGFAPEGWTAAPDSKPAPSKEMQMGRPQRFPRNTQEGALVLDADEQQLLGFYRMLSPMFKAQVMHMAASCNDTQPMIERMLRQGAGNTQGTPERDGKADEN